MQLIGALYLGFAMMNWMAKSLVIGGIYARPLAMGNLVHFLVGALALIKFVFSTDTTWVVWGAAVIYSLFAVVFAIVLFTHPISKSPTSSARRHGEPIAPRLEIDSRSEEAEESLNDH
ncbi:MAG: hypothetical protein WAU71_06880 [Pyrinomonadaceae bacterium]